MQFLRKDRSEHFEFLSNSLFLKIVKQIGQIKLFQEPRSTIIQSVFQPSSHSSKHLIKRLKFMFIALCWTENVLDTEKIELGDLFRTADARKNFSNGDTTSWSFELHTYRESPNVTIPIHHFRKTHQSYKLAMIKNWN